MSSPSSVEETASSGSGYIENLATGIAEWAGSSFESQNATDHSSVSSYTGGLMDTLLTPDVLAVQIKTLVRVGVPSILWALGGMAVYPTLANSLAGIESIYDDGVLAVLSQDSSQYVQNVLTTSGLTFSILIGQTYYFMYQQQEAVFYALFEEVSEAKSLLEQVSLVCAGRSMYQKVLLCISAYVSEDLKQINRMKPAELLSSRPADDPLESIMFLTSVGVPGVVYDTVKSLRTARAHRLGAMQRKLPDIQLIFLRLLGAVVLATFPVCGSGSQVIGGQELLRVQAVFFGFLVFGIVMVLGVIEELWKPRGGAYNIDGVLSIMIQGLEEELDARLSGELGYGGTANIFDASPYFPSAQSPSDSSWGGDHDHHENSQHLAESNMDNNGREETFTIPSRRKRITNWIRNRRGKNS